MLTKEYLMPQLTENIFCVQSECILVNQIQSEYKVNHTGMIHTMTLVRFAAEEFTLHAKQS